MAKTKCEKAAERFAKEYLEDDFGDCIEERHCCEMSFKAGAEALLKRAKRIQGNGTWYAELVDVAELEEWVKGEQGKEE